MNEISSFNSPLKTPQFALTSQNPDVRKWSAANKLVLICIPLCASLFSSPLLFFPRCQIRLCQSVSVTYTLLPCLQSLWLSGHFQASTIPHLLSWVPHLKSPSAICLLSTTTDQTPGAPVTIFYLHLGFCCVSLTARKHLNFCIFSFLLWFLLFSLMWSLRIDTVTFIFQLRFSQRVVCVS